MDNTEGLSWEGPIGSCSVTKDAAEHSIIHRAASIMRNYPDPNISSAKAGIKEIIVHLR